MTPRTWKPGQPVTASGARPDVSFRYAGSIFCAPPIFRFLDPSLRVIADCTSFEAVMAAHRLLTSDAASQVPAADLLNPSWDPASRHPTDRPNVLPPFDADGSLFRRGR